MKYKQELINWFNDIFNNCYYVSHNDMPNSIFMYYDLRYVRKLKLSKLENKVYLPQKKISGECLFEQDWKNKYLWCDYNNIWKYIADNYSSNYNDIVNFIKERLEENTNELVPKLERNRLLSLEDYTKMNVMVLTPNFSKVSGKIGEQYLYTNVLTPYIQTTTSIFQLKDYAKMNILTIQKKNK